MNIVRWLAALVALASFNPFLQGQGSAQVRLILNAEEARPGGMVLAGVHLKMPDGWHTYWKNGGDSGDPARIQWELPPGMEAGPIQWPVPEKYVTAGLTSYIYEDEVVLVVPISLGAEVAEGAHPLKAKVSWLECKEVCLPGSAQVQASLRVGAETRRSPHHELIELWTGRMPEDGAFLKPSASWAGEVDGENRKLRLDWVVEGEVFEADFFPYPSEAFSVLGATETLERRGDRMAIETIVQKYEQWPETLEGLIVFRPAAGGALKGFEIAVPIEAMGVVKATGEGATFGFFLLMLGAAFLGGIILNVMPCVLPVIALKVLGFVNQSRESPERVRLLGGVFTLGILFSFLILAGLVIGVQRAGQVATWGMQFSNPYFLVGLTVLMVLVALNLFGVFEINLGGKVMGTAGSLASREGMGGAFFHGILITLLATPCTAPILGAALGFAFTQPPVSILLFFLAIGLGLALPYLLLSLNPNWIRFLPRPGPWMERFKVLMGFPMLAAAIWLFWVASGFFVESAILWIALFLVIVALGLWVWGEFVQRSVSGSYRGLAMAVSLILLGGGYYFTLERQLNWRSETALADEGFMRVSAGGIEWQPWSPEAVEEARAAGRPVLVDFTAKWCINCQVNKATSLEVASVREKLKEINAVALVADYTRFPPRIAEELQRYNRAGVPLVLVYPADPESEAIVLPELLTPSMVLRALEKAADGSYMAQNRIEGIAAK